MRCQSRGFRRLLRFGRVGGIHFFPSPKPPAERSSGTRPRGMSIVRGKLIVVSQLHDSAGHTRGFVKTNKSPGNGDMGRRYTEGRARCRGALLGNSLIRGSRNAGRIERRSSAVGAPVCKAPARRCSGAWHSAALGRTPLLGRSEQAVKLRRAPLPWGRASISIDFGQGLVGWSC